jgi:SnoaL-like domain
VATIHRSLPGPVATALQATNDNDVDAFLRAFTADGVVDDWGREFVGPTAIRAWSDREFIGQHVTLDIQSVANDGDTTVVVAEVGGDGFNGPSHFRFNVHGDRVSRMTIRA